MVLLARPCVLIGIHSRHRNFKRNKIKRDRQTAAQTSGKQSESMCGAHHGHPSGTA